MSKLINITDYSNTTADECEPGNFIFWTCFTIVSSLFGFPGAVAILLNMFWEGRKGATFTPNDVFILNISIMDLVYFSFAPLELYTTNVGHPNLVYLAFISFLYSFTLCGRPLYITCICLDCYVAVVHPIIYREKKSLTPRILVAVGVWTVTVAYACCFAFGLERELEMNPVSFFILTLPVIAFCDLSILWTLKRSNPGGRNVHPQKKRALQIIISNFVVSIISYLPAVITWVLFQVLKFSKSKFFCLFFLSMICITVTGNTVSVMLHLSNIGKLDWLKCGKKK